MVACAFFAVTAFAFSLQAKTKSSQQIDYRNICVIFHHHPEWKYSAFKASRKWKVPASTLMAIIYQESRFRAYAKNKRTSASGFAQATAPIWKQYKKERGVKKARRSNFNSSIDFIGWYTRKAIKAYKISPHNTYALYLRYQLGFFYHKNSYVPRSSRKIANKVARMARAYKVQQKRC